MRAWFFFAFFVGCSPSPPADDDTVQTDDDTVADDDTAGGCADVVLRDESIWIDEEGADCQIHANAASSGSGVWVAYNAPRDDGWFDVFVAHVGCDGAVTVPPTRVNADDGANHVDPAVAVSAGRALVAWHRDDGLFPYNLSIHRAVVDEEGTVVSAAAALELTTEEGNAWMPAVAALPDGGFAVAGSRGHEEYGIFQVFVQRLDEDGEPSGDTMDVADAPDSSQTSAAMAANEVGDLVVAWTAGFGDDEQVRFAALAAGADTASAPTDLQGGSTSYSPALPSGDPAVVAATLDSGGSAKILTRPTSTEDGAWELSEAGQFIHTASLASAGDTGALAAYRMVSGLSHDLLLARWTRDGDTLSHVVTEEIATDPAAAPYAPALAHVADDVWFVAWSEGANPDYRVRGRFVDFGS